MSSANLLTLTEANFEQDVIKSATPVLVDFWAPWCGPCRMIAPVLDELAAEYAGRLAIGKVNVDDNQNLAVQYNVSSIPMLLLFKNGEVIKQIMGAKSKKAYAQEIDQALV